MAATANNSKLLALISLLDDPDAAIFNQVSEQIIAHGIDSVPVLQEKLDNTFEAETQKRIENVIHTIQFLQTKMDLENWVKFGSLNLLLGYVIVSKYQYPDLDEDKIRNSIDGIKQKIWLEFNPNLTFLEKIMVFNKVFYDNEGFTSNTNSIHSPQHFLVNTVLETKKGNSLSLGMLYIIFAQSLLLPVYGVNMPDHFILAFTNELMEENTASGKKEILFYINPFSKGAIFGKEAIDLYIKQAKLDRKDDYFTPCTNLCIIKRLLVNLIRSYKQIGNTSKKQELEELYKIVNG